MERPEATAIVVKMAEDRDKDSPEGEALRIVLRELREQRVAAKAAGEAMDKMGGMLDAAAEG